MTKVPLCTVNGYACEKITKCLFPLQLNHLTFISGFKLLENGSLVFSTCDSKHIRCDWN